MLNKEQKKPKQTKKSTKLTAVTALIQIDTCSPFQHFSCMDTTESHLKLCGSEDEQGSKIMGQAGNVIWNEIFHKQRIAVLEIAIHLKQ